MTKSVGEYHHSCLLLFSNNFIPFENLRGVFAFLMIH